MGNVLRKPDTSRGFAPPIPGTDEIRIASRDSLRMDGRLDESLLGPSIHQLLLSMARLRNVVSSLRIEGEDIDLKGARLALETQRAETPAQEQVLRLSRAYTSIQESRPSKLPEFSVATLLDVHRDLFEGVDPQAGPGRLKTELNGVLDATTGRFVFEATPPSRTPVELDRLFEWWDATRNKALPVAVAAIFFAELQAIHPFHDGNGRVGRLMGAMALKKLGYENVALAPLDGRFFRTQDKYYEKLATTNAGKDYRLWVRYFGDQLVRAYAIGVRRADLKPLLDAQSRPSTRSVLEWVLYRDATPFQHADYPNPHRYSRESVKKSLAQLVEHRILELKGARRGSTYRLTTEFLQRVYAGETT